MTIWGRLMLWLGNSRPSREVLDISARVDAEDERYERKIKAMKTGLSERERRLQIIEAAAEVQQRRPGGST